MLIFMVLWARLSGSITTQNTSVYLAIPFCCIADMMFIKVREHFT